MNPFLRLRSKMSPLTKEQWLIDALLGSLADLYTEDSNNSTVPAYSAATYVTVENYVTTYLKSSLGADNPAYKYIASVL